MLPDWKIILYANQLRENIAFNYYDPIVDIDDFVIRAGYEYLEENFDDDFSGLSKSIGSGNYLIGFNKNHYWSEKFRRFTIAHELGHLSIPEHRKILDQLSLHRSKPEYKSKDEIEIEADKFAINFLAPKQTFTEKSKYKRFDFETIRKLSDYFQISTYATALHFVDLSDLACSLIINNKNGNIIYEKRSKPFSNGFFHPFLYNQKIPVGTQTFDFINEITTEMNSEIKLSSWYPNLKNKITATECIIELGYNNYILTLIEPHKSSDEQDEY